MGIQFDGINNEIKSQTKIDFPGSVGVAGTLTYEDVANVDSVGLITARTGIKIGPTAGVAGTFFADGSYVTAGIITATTFYGSGINLTGIDTDLVNDTSPQLGGNLDTNSHEISLDTSHAINFGDSNELRVFYHSGNGQIDFNGTTSIQLKTPANKYFQVLNRDTGDNIIQCQAGGEAGLYYNGTKTAWTHGSGFNIKGKNTSDQTELIISGNEGRNAEILLAADDGDDNADYWKIISSNDNSFYLQNYTAGAYETNIKATGNGAVILYHDNVSMFETESRGAFVRKANGGDTTFTIGSTNASGVRLCLDGDSNGDAFGNDYAYLQHNTDGNFIIAADNPAQNGQLIFASGNANQRAKFDASGHFQPVSNNTYDLGTTSERWRNIYTNDLNLSNEGNTNDVDGTWGNYTIQEGESDLFLINNRNGKKYKFNLTEVN